MKVRGSEDTWPVSVSPHPCEPNAYIVKYLGNGDRGSRMAIYDDQIARGTVTFTNASRITIQLPPVQKTNGCNYALFACISLIIYIVLVSYVAIKQRA